MDEIDKKEIIKKIVIKIKPEIKSVINNKKINLTNTGLIDSFDIIRIIVEINKINLGEYLFLKFIFFNDMVGILLTIKKPIKPRLIKFRYGFFKNIKSNSKNINIGNKVKPAAAGEGTPVK